MAEVIDFVLVADAGSDPLSLDFVLEADPRAALAATLDTIDLSLEVLDGELSGPAVHVDLDTIDLTLEVGGGLGISPGLDTIDLSLEVDGGLSISLELDAVDLTLEILTGSLNADLSRVLDAISLTLSVITGSLVVEGTPDPLNRDLDVIDLTLEVLDITHDFDEAASMRTVTGKILKPDGTPWARVYVRFELQPGSYDTWSLRPSGTVQVQTLHDGTFEIDLWTNVIGEIPCEYTCYLPSGDEFTFSLPQGSSPVSLMSLELQSN